MDRRRVLFVLHARGVSSKALALLWLPVAVGCRAPLPHPPYAAQPQSALVPLETAPPPGRIETIPPRPPDADAWIDGEWILRHGRWYWLLGRWVKTPPGARYAPWVVVRSSDGTPWYAPSTWRDHHGAPLQPPTPLAYATASGEAIVDPEGEPEDTGRSIKTAPPAHAPTQERPPEAP